MGAGAALARDASADAARKPAASDVTAQGRGKRAAAAAEPTCAGGRGAAAAFLRARSADHVRLENAKTLTPRGRRRPTGGRE